MPDPVELPIACSLSSDEMTRRGEEMSALAGDALLGHGHEAGLVRLEFARAAEAAVHDLVSRERECCPFLDIRVQAEGDRLVVSIRGSTEAQPVLDAIYASAAG
jgi:hypothetical protein